MWRTPVFGIVPFASMFVPAAVAITLVKTVLCETGNPTVSEKVYFIRNYCVSGCRHTVVFFYFAKGKGCQMEGVDNYERIRYNKLNENDYHLFWW